MMTTATSANNTGLEIRVQAGSAGCALVAVRGELDGFTGHALSSRVDELIASGRTMITLDLSELAFIDSAGHRTIAGIADRAEDVGGDVHLGGCSPTVRRFLDLTSGVLASAGATTRSSLLQDAARPPRAVGF